MATSLDLSRTYTSYSGVDIRVIVNGAAVGSMQALSYAIQREKAPIYVMGSVDPVSYSRGKRGIAGTMISLMMDSHLLYSQTFRGEQYYGDKYELRPKVNDEDLANLDNEVITSVQLEGGYGEGIKATNSTNASFPGINVGQRSGTTSGRAGFNAYNDQAQINMSDVNADYGIYDVLYVDQILPFDITIVAANEYGQTAQMRLYGCEILNEGSGFSIDDIVIENQMTYVCRTILPWRTYKSENDDLIKNLNSKTVRNGTSTRTMTKPT